MAEYYMSDLFNRFKNKNLLANHLNSVQFNDVIKLYEFDGNDYVLMDNLFVEEFTVTLDGDTLLLQFTQNENDKIIITNTDLIVTTEPGNPVDDIFMGTYTGLYKNVIEISTGETKVVPTIIARQVNYYTIIE